LLDLARQIQDREKKHSKTIRASSGASLVSKRTIKLDTTIGALITKTDETLRIPNDIQLKLTGSVPAAHRVLFLGVAQAAGAVVGLAVGMASMSLTMTNSAAVGRLQKSIATKVWLTHLMSSEISHSLTVRLPRLCQSLPIFSTRFGRSISQLSTFCREEVKLSSQTSNAQSLKLVESHECEANSSGMLGAIQPSLVSQTLVERAF
jgi:hypothetical protein